jgi:methionine-rich copper-binding protein CopC
MTPIRLRRSVAAAVSAAFFLLFAWIAPAVVLGHAELATMAPADKASGPAPTAIVATFTEDLDPSGSSLAVVNGSGSVVAKGGVVDATDKKTMRLDLTGVSLATGGYTIRWQSKSAQDGDLDRGTTTFTVTASSPAPSASTAPPSAAASPSSTAAGPSGPASTAPSPSASGGTATSASSSDALIPILVALVVIILLGAWLLRGRGRRAA